jgi:plastocyanin
MIRNTIQVSLAVLLGAILVLAVSAGFSATQAEESNAVVIKTGTTVTWKNLDGEPHTVVNDAGLFRSAALDQNDTYQFKFDKPGVYQIFCGIHPNMKATITVQ